MLTQPPPMISPRGKKKEEGPPPSTHPTLNAPPSPTLSMMISCYTGPRGGAAAVHATTKRPASAPVAHR